MVDWRSDDFTSSAARPSATSSGFRCYLPQKKVLAAPQPNRTKEPQAADADANSEKDGWVLLTITRIGKSETTHLQCRESDLLEDVKKRIEEAVKIPMSQQRLLHGTAALEDSPSSLAKLGLSGEVSLTVVNVPILWVAALRQGADLGEIGESSVFFDAKSFTIETWLRLHAFARSDFNTLLGGPWSGAALKDGHVFCGFSGGRPLLSFGTAETKFLAPMALEERAWTHVAFMYDRRAACVRITVGGEEVFVATDITPKQVTNYTIIVGGFRRERDSPGDSMYSLHGQLASLSIWTKVVTEQELQTCVQSGPPTPQRAFVHGLARSWTFHRNLLDDSTYCLDAVSCRRMPIDRYHVVEARDRPF